jgi:hypothetical protein
VGFPNINLNCNKLQQIFHLNLKLKEIKQCIAIFVSVESKQLYIGNHSELDADSYELFSHNDRYYHLAKI